MTAARVHRLARAWLFELGLDRLWHVGVRVNARPKDCEDEEHRDAVSFIEVKDGYFSARLDVNAYNLIGEDLEQVVAHEMMHVVLWRLAALCDAGHDEKMHGVIRVEVEDVVESVSRALARLKKRGRR